LSAGSYVRCGKLVRNVWNANEDLRSAEAIREHNCVLTRVLWLLETSGPHGKREVFTIFHGEQSVSICVERRRFSDEEGAKKRLKIIGALHFLSALESVGPAIEVRY